MMTPKQREAAARELCRLYGKDPDATIGGRPTWILWINEIECQLKMQAAIEFGRAQKEEGE